MFEFIGIVVCIIIGFVLLKTIFFPDIKITQSPKMTGRHHKHFQLIQFFKNLDITLDVLEANENKIFMASTSSSVQISFISDIKIIFNTNKKDTYSWEFPLGENYFTMFENIRKTLSGEVRITNENRIEKIDKITNMFSILAGDIGKLSSTQVNNRREIKYITEYRMHHNLIISYHENVINLTWIMSETDFVKTWTYDFNTNLDFIKINVEQSVYGIKQQYI